MEFNPLIIAPTLTPHHKELPSAKDEVEAIRRWHPTSVALPMDVQPGHVDAMSIASTMGQITYRNLFWFVTGADKDGIFLSDGKMPLETLVMLSKFHDIRYAVLNTCDSKRTAEQLSIQCGIDVICHVGEVDDQDALLFATVFSQKLAEVGEFEEAYRDVATIGTEYEYISYEQLQSSVTRGYRDERNGHDLEMEIAMLKATIATMWRVIVAVNIVMAVLIFGAVLALSTVISNLYTHMDESFRLIFQQLGTRGGF